MNTTSAGWFPDPHGQAQLRYFDGSEWTEHIHGGEPKREPAQAHAQTPAWSALQAPPQAGPPPLSPVQAPPQMPTPAPVQAQAPATQEDDGVLLQAEIALPMHRHKALVMDGSSLHFGDTMIRYADITGFGYLVTKQSMNGVPTATVYQVDVHTAAGKTKISFSNASISRNKGEKADLWMAIVSLLSEKVEPRLLKECADRVAAGQEVAIGPLTLDQTGIKARRAGAKAITGRMAPKTAPWRDYLEVRYANGMTEVHVADPGSKKGRKRVALVPNLEPSAGLLPAMLRTLADRYAVS